MRTKADLEHAMLNMSLFEFTLKKSKIYVFDTGVKK
jgi:hypothetical protein